MEAAGPKVEFFTPATFKHVADHVRGLLVHGTGYDWQAARITKSNRKLGGGSQELYFEGKLFPADKHKPVEASVEATLETASTQMRITTTVRVEKSFKTVYEARHEPKTFQEAQQWFSHVAISGTALEDIKTASYDYDRRSPSMPRP